MVADDGQQNEAHKEDPYLKPFRSPTDGEKRNMLAKSVEIMIITSMENHVYKFGNEIRRQKEGGPIGLALTGEIAECYMINWDKLFLEKLKSLGISPEIYERFKDDITMMLEVIEKGTKFEDGQLVVDEGKKSNDEEKSDEEITMEVIKDVADSIDDMIRFTVDYPTNYKNNKLPILDIEASINTDQQNRIDYQFFEKPTKNKFVILSTSAISAKQKRTILTQECLRRLRNTKIELGEEVQNKYLNEFMVKLKNSGYTVKYRRQILDSALKAFEKMVEDDRNNVKPLYRNKNWNKDERKKEKENRKLNWYKNGGGQTGAKPNKVEYKSVLFVPVTKGGILAKELQKREEEVNKSSKQRIKIVEDGGVKLKDFLICKDPFPTLKCKKKKCILCESEIHENLKFPCNSNNVGYQLECETCFIRGKSMVYEGETSRSARIRGGEHIRDFEKKKSSSVLYKHKVLEHKDEEMRIKMQITKKFRDPLTRQANEGVRINSRCKNELLNSKTEFNHPPIPRITVERKPFFKRAEPQHHPSDARSK